jgi:uncharacterized membrane protein YeaQ/YmgE (transglycosylase-associated protein family)
MWTSHHLARAAHQASPASKERTAMGIGAFILLIVAALVLGFVAQMIATPRFSYDWAIAAIGGAIGAFVAGQYLGVLTTWGPLYDGMYLLPAALGAIIVAAAVEAVVRLTGPTTTTA